MLFRPWLARNRVQKIERWKLGGGTSNGRRRCRACRYAAQAPSQPRLLMGCPGPALREKEGGLVRPCAQPWPQVPGSDALASRQERRGLEGRLCDSHPLALYAAPMVCRCRGPRGPSASWTALPWWACTPPQCLRSCATRATNASSGTQRYPAYHCLPDCLPIAPQQGPGALLG